MHESKFRSLANELWIYVIKNRMSVADGVELLRKRYKLTSFAVGHVQRIFATSPLYRSMTRLYERKKVA